MKRNSVYMLDYDKLNEAVNLYQTKYNDAIECMKNCFVMWGTPRLEPLGKDVQEDERYAILS